MHILDQPIEIVGATLSLSTWFHDNCDIYGVLCSLAALVLEHGLEEVEFDSERHLLQLLCLLL